MIFYQPMSDVEAELENTSSFSIVLDGQTLQFMR